MEQQEKQLGRIKSIIKTNTYFKIQYEHEFGRIYMLNGHTFRYYVSSNKHFIDFPVPNAEENVAKIVTMTVDQYDTVPFEISLIVENEDSYMIDAEHIQICFDKQQGTLSIKDKRTDKVVLQEAKSLILTENKSAQVLVNHGDEHFFGGGMQNGRFAHKGDIIKIVNTNNWIDNGVTSPNPFYWSSYGYGIMRNTWQPGVYDFGNKFPRSVKTIHNEKYYDAFYFINEHPKDILLDYYQLTGRPILLPEYAFYEAHLNTFNRDYWVKCTNDTKGAILFEDGEYYKKYKPSDIGNKEGILESLNGELNNYQFSARAMIDRYRRHDMPLGWFIPNDGYGSGYGQTDSLQGDIDNLKKFAEYSRENGVEVALWTESNLRPKDPQHPKKGERDLNQEVSQAGVVALKCDVAWIGDGYSFGLNAVETANDIFEKATQKHIRPFIIMVDGWAGTQRYAGIWSGDQSGGEWEYIRFHIPTYIGTGLSGQPIVGSDMDGIYDGGKKNINIRDYQWKTFTPLQLNMDGWGSVPKTPFTFDDEAKNINRAYLKLKSMLMPYNYTINHQAIRGLPMVRAMFLEFPNEFHAYTNDSKYQYMWGPSILVAPVYTPESYRNGIYLPGHGQIWIDFLTGVMYQGGKIYNNIKTPLWKIPVFVKNGAIIPMSNPNNNPHEIQRDSRIFNLYPWGKSSFEVYEDDGMSMEYSKGHIAKTKVKMVLEDSSNPAELYVSIEKTVGNYKGMVKDRKTLIRVMTSVEAVTVEVNSHGEFEPIKKAETEDEFDSLEDVYFVKNDLIVNPYLRDFAEEELRQKFLLIKLKKVDVTKQKLHVKVVGFANEKIVFGSQSSLASSITPPTNFMVNESETTPTSATLSWDAAGDGTSNYEIERDNIVFSNIIENKITFDGLKYSTEYSFRIRAVSDGVSEWSNPISVITKEDPYINTVKDVKVSCNFPCQPSQEVSKLTVGEDNTFWHTHWGAQGEANPKEGKILKLNFDLGQAYEVDKVEYVPRDDAGNGTILELQYKHSVDGNNWTFLSENIVWNKDSMVKTIALNGVKLRYMELNLLKTVGNFGSGKRVYFYKKVQTVANDKV